MGGVVSDLVADSALDPIERSLVLALAGVFVLFSWARRFTVSVPPSTDLGVYIGTGKLLG